MAKRLVFVLIISVVFNSYGQNNIIEKKIDLLHQDKGVIINGVKWATRNIDKPGTFTVKPEDSGMFYQWNHKVAWETVGYETEWDEGEWNNSESVGNTWEKINDPSPVGWHVPTFDEIMTLVDSEKVNGEWITQNGINGIKFTDKTTGNSIFLPAVGFRTEIYGYLSDAGLLSFYWSSTQQSDNSTQCYCLYGNSDWVNWATASLRLRLSIRSVAD